MEGQTELKISAIRDSFGRYEIKLSTDDKRNLNFIVGGAGMGKTTLFNKVIAGVSNKGGDVILDLEGDVPHDDYIAVDEHPRLAVLQKDLRDSEISENTLAGIVDRANHMLQKIHGMFDNKSYLLRLNGRYIEQRLILDDGPVFITYLALYIAIREQQGIKAPLIIDSCFDLEPVILKHLMQMIAENTPQALIFIPDKTMFEVRESTNWIEHDETEGVSLYEKTKNDGTLGSLYELGKGGISKKF